MSMQSIGAMYNLSTLGHALQKITAFEEIVSGEDINVQN